MLRTNLAIPPLITIPVVALSENAVAAIELADASGSMMAGQMLQVFFALAITLATIWGLSKVAVKKRWNKGSEQQRIKILDSVAIGTRDRIMLIEVDDQNIVVATTPGRIQSLHSFEKSLKSKTSELSFKNALDISQKPSAPEISQ